MCYNLVVETAMYGLSVTIHQHPLFAYRTRAAVSTTELITGVTL